MVLPFLQEKYPKYIHNIFVLFFLQKVLQKRFFLFSVKTNFQKMPHTTSRTLHTSRKSPVSCIHYLLLLFFRQRSFFTNLLPLSFFSRVLFVVGWKLLLLLSFLNMFKLVCCLDWFYEKCTTKYGEHSRRLKDDKTNTKGIEIFSSPKFFLIPGDEKNSRWILIPGLLVSQDQKNDVLIPGISNS